MKGVSCSMKSRFHWKPSQERGVVFQRYSVFPHLNVQENVALGLEFAQAPLLGKLFGRKKRAILDECPGLS